MVRDLRHSGGTISSQQLFRSDDGGQTWSLLAQYGFESVLTKPIDDFGVLPARKILVLVFVTPDVGWSGTDALGPTVFSTHDGGKTWTPASIKDPTRVVAINCSDVERCTITMTDATWTTNDGGETWISVT